MPEEQGECDEVHVLHVPLRCCSGKHEDDATVGRDSRQPLTAGFSELVGVTFSIRYAACL